MTLTLRAAAVALGLIAAGPAAADELSLAHFMSPQHPMDQRVMRPMAEAFAEATGGSGTITIYPAGELGAGPVQQYRRVVTGVADLVFVVAGFTADQFPHLTGYQEAGRFDDGVAATRAMWQDIEAIRTEIDRAEVLAVWANNPTILITRDRPVRSLADVEGLRVRIADDDMAALITAWGGTPIAMPPTDAYLALDNGVVDAIFIDPAAFRSYSLYEVTDYATVNIPGTISTFFIAANHDAMGALTEDEQAALREVTGEALSLQAAEVFAAVGTSALDLAVENGVEIIALDDAARAEFAAAAGLQE